MVLVPPPIFPGPFPTPNYRPALHAAPYPPPFPPMPLIAPGNYSFAGRRFLYRPPLAPVMLKAHPLFVPMGPPIVMLELCNQINYYFSDENLVRDVYLRKKMDEHGWVMVKEITAKVKSFLDEKEINTLLYILNAMLNSYIVEVHVETHLGNKLRKRFGWQKYILRNIGQSSSTAETHVNAK